MSFQKSDTVTGEPHSYIAALLKVSCPTAEVNVQPHDGRDLVVTISGPRERVEHIKTRVHRGTLTVEQTSPGGAPNVIVSDGAIVIGNVGPGQTIHMGNMFIGSGSFEPPATVDVLVPVGTPVSLDGSTGTTVIGNIESPVFAAVTSGKLEIGRIASLRLKVSSGDVTVNGIRGDAAIRVNGSGEVHVRSGEIDALDVDINGSGDIVIVGTAQQARLAINGAGDISVSRVVGEVSQRINGAGNIRVLNRG